MTATAYPAVFEAYTSKRDGLKAWAERHLVQEFGLPMGRFLDAGCAEGFWADLFVDLGYDAHGFDILPLYIENGRKRYPRISLEVADILGELPYDEPFDVVFCRGIPQFSKYHLTDMKRALTNLLTITAGTLLLSIYSDDSGERRPGAFSGFFWHHTHADYIRACTEVSDVKHYATVGNYLQVAL